jgi:hypothetical protein
VCLNITATANVAYIFAYEGTNIRERNDGINSIHVKLLFLFAIKLLCVFNSFFKCNFFFLFTQFGKIHCSLCAVLAYHESHTLTSHIPLVPCATQYHFDLCAE